MSEYIAAHGLQMVVGFVMGLVSGTIFGMLLGGLLGRSSALSEVDERSAIVIATLRAALAERADPKQP